MPDATPTTCACGKCQPDPLRAAIIAGLLFKSALDTAPLSVQERYDMQDIIDMMVTQLREHQ